MNSSLKNSSVPLTSAHGASPVSSQSAEVNQQRGEAILIWLVGAFCIFGWEYMLCLPNEYKRIWKKPLTASSYLYIGFVALAFTLSANRYFGIVQLCFVVSLGANAWGRADCKHMYYWEPVGALISTVLSQMILGTRVYAIYGRSRWIAGLLILVLATEIGIGGFSVSTTALPPAPPVPGVKPPCGSVIGSEGWLIAFWSIPILYDALAFFLTAWKAYEFWIREINTPLFTVIWRDGVLYFFAIFTMNVANIIIFITVAKMIRPINLTPTLIFEIVLSCRLLLNLRGMNESSSNALIKPALGRRDLLGSEGSKPRARGTQSADRASPGIFEMTQPPPISIPYSRSVDVFPAYDTNVKAKQFLDIGKQSSGWLR